MVAPVSSGGGGSGGGVYVPASSQGTTVTQTVATTPVTTQATGFSQSPVSPAIFSRTLKLGSKGNDVLALQRFLNTHGFVIAKTGQGAPGKETDTFGTLTQKALIKFQEAYRKQILVPAGLTKGTGVAGKSTFAFIALLNLSPK